MATFSISHALFRETCGAGSSQVGVPMPTVPDHPRRGWWEAMSPLGCGAIRDCRIGAGDPYYVTRSGLIRCKAHAPVPFVETEIRNAGQWKERADPKEELGF